MTRSVAQLQAQVDYYKQHPPETDYQRGYAQALEDVVDTPIAHKRESWLREVDRAAYDFLCDLLDYEGPPTLIIVILLAVSLGASGAIGFALGALHS